MAESQEMAYVAINPICGGAMAATVDDGCVTPKELAKNIGAWLRCGDRVERVTLEAVRSEIKWCDCPLVKGKRVHVAPEAATQAEQPPLLEAVNA